MRQFKPSYLTNIPRKQPEKAHPLVRILFQEMMEQQVGMFDVADRAGINRVTVSSWRYRQSPTVTTLEAALNVMGLELKVGPKTGNRRIRSDHLPPRPMAQAAE